MFLQNVSSVCEQQLVAASYLPESILLLGSSGEDLVSSFSVNLLRALSWFLTACQVTLGINLPPLVAFNPFCLQLYFALCLFLSLPSPRSLLLLEQQVASTGESLVKSRWALCAEFKSKYRFLTVLRGLRRCSERMDGSQTFYLRSLSPLTPRCGRWLVRDPDVRGQEELCDWTARALLCLDWPHEVSLSCHKLLCISHKEHKVLINTIIL